MHVGTPHPFDINPGEDIYIDLVAEPAGAASPHFTFDSQLTVPPVPAPAGTIAEVKLTGTNVQPVTVRFRITGQSTSLALTPV